MLFSFLHIIFIKCTVLRNIYLVITNGKGLTINIIVLFVLTIHVLPSVQLVHAFAWQFLPVTHSWSVRNLPSGRYSSPRLCWALGIYRVAGIPRLYWVLGIHRVAGIPGLCWVLGIYRVAGIPRLYWVLGIYRVAGIPLLFRCLVPGDPLEPL